MEIDTSFVKNFFGPRLLEILDGYATDGTNGYQHYYDRLIKSIHTYGMEVATKSSADLAGRIRVLEAERDHEQQRYELLRSNNVMVQHELARVEAKAAEDLKIFQRAEEIADRETREAREVIAKSHERDEFERLFMDSNAELTKELNSAHAATVAAQDELARMTQINDNTAGRLVECRADLDAMRRRYVEAAAAADTLAAQLTDIIRAPEGDEDFLEVTESVLRKRARKIGGSFQADGNIVADFKNMAGERRLVLEFAAYPGMLHIYNPNQIEIYK